MALKMQPAPGAEGAPDEPGKAPKKKLNPKVLIIAAAVVLALAAGVALRATRHHGRSHTGPQRPQVGEVVTLDDFMLNLADPSNTHYLKATIALGLKKGVSADSFKDEVPATRDAIVMVLTSKRLDQVRTEPGKIELKQEIMDSVNQAIGKRDVVAVYFEGFATQ